jgi:predicted DNA-binding protein (UPF0251 family)
LIFEYILIKEADLMVRPQKNRRVALNPEISYFKPRGIPMMQLEEVRLTVDEREAIRLSDALINGKAINVEGGNYRIVSETRIFKCNGCSHVWEEEKGTGRPRQCPNCKQDDLYRILQD